MNFGETTGIKHIMIRKQGKIVGWETKYLTSTQENPLNLAQLRNWQRKQKAEDHEKNWKELLESIGEDESEVVFIPKKNQQKPGGIRPANWQKPLPLWIVIWKKDAELRKLFNNNYRHMRLVAKKKNYTREWVNRLKQEECLSHIINPD